MNGQLLFSVPSCMRAMTNGYCDAQYRRQDALRQLSPAGTSKLPQKPYLRRLLRLLAEQQATGGFEVPPR